MSGDEKMTTEEQPAAEAVEETSPAPESAPPEEATTEVASPSETPAAEADAPAEVTETSTDTSGPSADEAGETPTTPTNAPDMDSAEPQPTEASAPEADATSTEEAKPERKRPRLNPMGADAAKAVPNLAAAPPAQPVPPAPVPAGMETEETAPESATETTDEANTEEAATPAAPPPPPPPSAEPVNVPTTDDLGDDLEAQIAAAMTSDERQAEEQAAAAEAARAAAEAQEEKAEEGDGDETEEKTPKGVVPVDEEDLEPGKRLTGKIISIHSDNVFLDIGCRMNAVVAKRQFQSNRPPAEGQLIQVVVDKVDVDEGLVQCNLPKGTGRVGGNWDRLSVGQVVECYVNKTNKGGLEVAVSGLRAFLPASQIDFRFVDDMEAYVGQKLRVKVTEVNPKKRNLVVSRRAVLVEERKESEKELWDRIEEGQTLEGEVKTLKPYGAFVDIGGADGFLHVGEISWNHIKDPSEVLRVGQTVEVKVLKLDREAKKIGLGMKQLAQNPWANVGTKYPEGSTVTGKVTRAMDFGAFVELEEGVEGLIHISELDHKRVRKVTDVVHVGRDVTVKVISIDARKKRIGLSVKALTDAPVQPGDEDLAPGAGEEYVRKRKGPLRGGTGTSEAGGGLFGNPDDFK